MGVPAVFLRLGGCNLLCGGKGTQTDKQLHDGATWRCDTIEVWQKHIKLSVSEVAQMFNSKLFTERLRKGAHLVVTGGEPLVQQPQLAELFLELAVKYGVSCFVEVETNGTVPLESQFMGWINQWNISPKLSNSGMPEKLRIVPDVIWQLRKMPRSYFKFVISCDADMQETIDTFINPFRINPRQVYLMPAAESQEELAERLPMVAKWAKYLGANLSNRMHIQIWNKKTGV